MYLFVPALRSERYSGFSVVASTDTLFVFLLLVVYLFSSKRQIMTTIIIASKNYKNNSRTYTFFL